MLESLFQLAGPVQALCATLMTWALTSLGACVVFLLRKPNRNVMDAMLGLAGGVMVAASFWSLLSPCIDMAGELGMRPWSTALIGFMGGGLPAVLGDRAFTHFSQKREAAGKNGRSAGSSAVPCWSFPLPYTISRKGWPSAWPLGRWPMAWKAPPLWAPGCWPWALAAKRPRAWR